MWSQTSGNFSCIDFIFAFCIFWKSVQTVNILHTVNDLSSSHSFTIVLHCESLTRCIYAIMLRKWEFHFLNIVHWKRCTAPTMAVAACRVWCTFHWYYKRHACCSYSYVLSYLQQKCSCPEFYTDAFKSHAGVSMQWYVYACLACLCLSILEAGRWYQNHIIQTNTSQTYDRTHTQHTRIPSVSWQSTHMW